MFKTIFIFSFLFLKLLSPGIVFADSNVVSESASIKSVDNSQKLDTRVLTLKKFLESKNSPLERYAEDFIYHADNNHLDWRLVISITGVESSFGKRIPKNSFNAYGWVNGDYKFRSWEESIKIVSETLNHKYYQKGATNINKIAKRYAPPSTTWSSKVKYFMEKIDPVPAEFDL